MRNPSPALCTTERLGVDSPPMKGEIPTMPSLPGHMPRRRRAGRSGSRCSVSGGHRIRCRTPPSDADARPHRTSQRLTAAQQLSCVPPSHCGGVDHEELLARRHRLWTIRTPRLCARPRSGATRTRTQLPDDERMGAPSRQSGGGGVRSNRPGAPRWAAERRARGCLQPAPRTRCPEIRCEGCGCLRQNGTGDPVHVALTGLALASASEASHQPSQAFRPGRRRHQLSKPLHLA